MDMKGTINHMYRVRNIADQLRNLEYELEEMSSDDMSPEQASIWEAAGECSRKMDELFGNLRESLDEQNVKMPVDFFN